LAVSQKERKIARVKSQYEESNISREEHLEYRQCLYEQALANYGEDSRSALSTGPEFAAALREAFHGVEAERLCSKLLAISLRLHGPNHDLSTKNKYAFNRCTERYVIVSKSGALDTKKIYRFLQYKDENICEVQGPCRKSRDKNEEKKITVATEDLIFIPGTPVICHGMEDSDHINGKIGDLRSWDEETNYYTVAFEDKNLEPYSVASNNFRLLLELPSIVIIHE